MTPLMLEESLIKKLEELFEGEKYINNSNILQEVKVVKGTPISRLSGNEEEYLKEIPIISVKFMKGKESKKHKTIGKVQIKVSIFNTTEEGQNEVLNIIEKIRQCLFKERILDGTFTLEAPLKIKIIESKNTNTGEKINIYPYWEGILDTRWMYYRIINVKNIDIIS